MKLIAKTFAGLEEVLAKEIESLGGTEIEPTKRGVIYEGDQRLLYRSNLELRTALRILKPIHTFRANNLDAFYKKVREIEWWRLMDLRHTFAIDAIARSKVFTHSHYVGLKTKDAIADQFRDKMNRRPSVDVERPDIQINVHVHEDEFSISLDASGESLHKRGYRQDTVAAPLNEVLAAGMIKLADWSGETGFFDAFCGSGTLLTEAALIAHRIPPQYRRSYFCCKNWLDFDKTLWEQVVDESDSHRVLDFKPRIMGSDFSGRSLSAAQRNIEAIGFNRKIKLEKADFFTRSAPANTEGGLMIINPPYDERLQLEDAIDFHKKIGDALKKNWKGWTVWVLSGNLEAAKFIGLRPRRKIHLYNGALECRFLKFEMY
ncbi:MAG: class I SAM-dependent RNA methyltransferase [Saprospiraceae bacterium]|nr:class I SAM-dependent RNA methyltransferase [Saprospiraceae bacterium]